MDNMNTQLGTKWFTFFTEIRPYFSCCYVFAYVFAIISYTEWLEFLFLVPFLLNTALHIMVAIKATGDYVDFVRFVKRVLLFEIFFTAYNTGIYFLQIEFQITLALQIALALIMAFFALFFGYFIWYRLNVKYFEKRILSKSIGDVNFESGISQESDEKK